MGLLPSLAVLLPLLLSFFCFPGVRAQPALSPRALDALLQDYAYRAFVRPKTGIPYDAPVPADFPGIKIAAMRLRNGSFRKRGYKGYREFDIPPGVVVQPYVERIVLVYQNLGNWSLSYYPLPGYTYLAPVIGLLTYNAANLSAKNLSELDIRTSLDPITIKFPSVTSAPNRSTPKCVWFDLSGSPSFSSVESGNVCSTTQQGHFSIVVESIAPSPEPNPSPVGPRPPGKRRKKKNNSKAWIILGSVLGGLLLAVLLSLMVLWAQKMKQRQKLQKMEKAAEVGESLQMTSVGETRAPAAMVTRTQPTLENEYVP